jgi:hypothetical protein
VDVGGRVLRTAQKRRAVTFGGFVVAAELVQDRAKVVVGRGIFWVACDERPKSWFGIGRSSVLEE